MVRMPFRIENRQSIYSIESPGIDATKGSTSTPTRTELRWGLAEAKNRRVQDALQKEREEELREELALQRRS